MPGSLSIGPHGIAVRASLVCVGPPGQGRARATPTCPRSRISRRLAQPSRSHSERSRDCSESQAMAACRAAHAQPMRMVCRAGECSGGARSRWHRICHPVRTQRLWEPRTQREESVWSSTSTPKTAGPGSPRPESHVTQEHRSGRGVKVAVDGAPCHPGRELRASQARACPSPGQPRVEVASLRQPGAVAAGMPFAL